MDQYEYLRTAHRVYGKNISELARQTGQVHYGQAQQILDQRAKVLESAFKEHAIRFKGKVPKPLPLPEAAWINKPDDSQTVLQ